MSGPRRILVHAGLPEGGPGSVARFLRLNREALAPAADLVLPAQLAEAAAAAAHFARHGQPLALADMAEALAAAVPATLGQGSGGGGRDAVLACKALSGEVPGGPGAPPAEAAPALAAVLAGFLQDRFPAAELRLVLTTDPHWARRSWLHRLATTRLRVTFAAFEARLDPAAPEEVVAAAAQAVAEAAPAAECFVLPLPEAERHPKGAGGALLELLDLPAAVAEALEPVRAARLPDAGVAAELLRLNASDLPDAPLREAKRALLEEHRLPLWAHLLAA